MAELIIKNKFDRKSRTSVVINIETEKKSEIEKLSLASGYSFNEIVEMLIDFALPLCKLEDVRPAIDKAKASSKEESPSKLELTDKKIEQITSKTKTTAKTATKKDEPVKPVSVSKKIEPIKPVSVSKKIEPVKPVSVSRKTEPVKPVASVITAPRTKAVDPHSSVPTFKIPPITVQKTTTNSSKK